MDPRLNEQFPVGHDRQLSPPSVREPIYDCARMVFVYGFVPHAEVTVYANGTEVIGTENPYVGFADIRLSRELRVGERVTATQAFLGLTSLQSYRAAVVQPGIPLGRPVVDPRLFDCGRVVPVGNLVPSSHVVVYQADTLPVSTDMAHDSGEADTAGTWQAVVTAQLHRGDHVVAEQVSCPGEGEERRSAPSLPVEVRPAPDPMPAPALDPPIVGNDAVTLRDLYVGAEIGARDATAGTGIGGGLANADANWFPVAPPIQAGHEYMGRQKLCVGSPDSVPEPSVDALSAPVLETPACDGDLFVRIRNTMINAVVVLLRNGVVAGIGGAMEGELTLAVGGGEALRFDDELSVVQYMGATVSSPSNTVFVGDCANVVTYKNDNRRTGAYLRETVLTPAVVSPGRFGRLYERNVDGDIYAQPLYVRNVQTRVGPKNLVFVATSTNEVYAFDANEASTDPAAGLVWRSGPLQRWRVLTEADICRETTGTVGITSTPVIDVHTRTMYVVCRRWLDPPDWNNPDEGATFLHALNIADGTQRREPIRIAGEVEGVRFDTRCQRNRPGLLLLNGTLLVAFGTFNCDQPCPGGRPYHGWVMAYDTGDLGLPPAVFCTSVQGAGAGVWQSGHGLTGSDDGSVYFETGNDIPGATAPLGDSFVRVQVDSSPARIALAATFTPSNAALLRDGDASLIPLGQSYVGDTDLGSGGPILLPGDRVVGGGKQGRLYVLDAGTLRPTQDGVPDPTIGEGFQAFRNTYQPGWSIQSYAAGEPYGPNIHGCPVYWSGTGLLYHMAEKDYMKAFHYDTTTGVLNELPVVSPTRVRPNDGMPGGFSVVSANGDQDGIVWTLYIKEGDGDGQWNKRAGSMVAFHARTLEVLWNEDSAYTFAKFCPPMVADGRVYRATHNSDVATGTLGKLVVYGLLNRHFPRPRPPYRWPPRRPFPDDYRRSIEALWRHYAASSGFLGRPTGKEIELKDAVGGRVSHFLGVVRGPGSLGVSVRPPEGQRATFHQPGELQRVNVESSIYWSERTGAYVVSGEIRRLWMDLGGHLSALGYPVSDEHPTPDGLGRISRFEYGWIAWYPDTDAVAHFSTGPSGGRPPIPSPGTSLSGTGTKHRP